MSTTSWFSRALLPWYREHARALPWRATKDPYLVWLSEVILQQTRVDQGTAYWLRFADRFPTVQALAKASEDEVLKLWQGLGYYSRARNLLTAAGQVVADHDGRFPTDLAELKGLKGVGDYTAAAVASICSERPVAVVDGNVYRVLARVFGIDMPIDTSAGSAHFKELAGALLDPKHPGDHNQAVMELGALVCKPRDPACSACPLAARCIARRTDRIADLPVKAGRTKVRTRHFNYLDIRTGSGGIWFQQRTGRDIWRGLYELPLLESEGPLTERRVVARLSEQMGPGWVVEGVHGPVKHLLSHQRILARFWKLTPPRDLGTPEHWTLVSRTGIDALAVPRLIERYLTEHPGPIGA